MGAKHQRVSPAPENPLGPLLSISEAAQYLGMTVKRLRRNISERRIQVLRDGKQFGIYHAWCDDFIRRCSIPLADTAPPRPKLADLLAQPGEELFLVAKEPPVGQSVGRRKSR